MLPDGLSQEQLTERQRHWLGHILRFKEVGGTLTAYAMEHGFTPRSYYYWRTKLGQLGCIESVSEATLPEFHKLDVVASFLEESVSVGGDELVRKNQSISRRSNDRHGHGKVFCQVGNGAPVIGKRRGGVDHSRGDDPPHNRYSLAMVHVRLPNGVSVEVAGSLDGSFFGEVLRHAAALP